LARAERGGGADAEAAAVARRRGRFTLSSSRPVVCVLPDVGRFRPLVWQSPASKHGLSPAIAHIHPQHTGMRMDTPSGQWAVSHKVLLAPVVV